MFHNFFRDFRFYLPHGLTVDDQDCLWVTDVGAHQVFKLTPLKENTNEVQVKISTQGNFKYNLTCVNANRF